jgi:hypothetical protein
MRLVEEVRGLSDVVLKEVSTCKYVSRAYELIIYNIVYNSAVYSKTQNCL